MYAKYYSLCVAMLLLVLNPYTVVGPLGYYAATVFTFLGIVFLKEKKLQTMLLCFLICVIISVFGVIISYFNNITQFEHLKVSLSILLYYIIGFGLFSMYGKRFKLDEILLISLLVVVLNSIIILVQVEVPSFRGSIESFFVPSGNIDWADGLRYRGIASGGGASLSLLSAVACYISLYLYSIKKINMVFLVFTNLIFLFSIFFIGRTGLLLIFISYTLVFFKLATTNVKRAVLFLITFLFFIILLFDFIETFLVDQYGEEFFRYTLGFMLDGRDGFEKEGTVGVLAEFLTVVPKQFPEIITGYGFYGGSDFYPWTDSGYSRMFLSVGYLLGIFFYFCIFYIFIKSSRGSLIIFLPLFAMLLVAEAKEGMLLSGYASRLFFILMGFYVCQKLPTK